MRISDWSSDVCSSDLFFDVALFQGGTSLRILNSLPRFSEDLDFLLRQADPDFDWTPYLKTLIEVFGQFGLKLDALPRAKMDTAIRQALIKNDSIASQLDLSFAGAGKPKRSEERRVGKEWFSTCRSRWSQDK